MHACIGNLGAAAAVCKGDIRDGLGREPPAVGLQRLLPLQFGACRASAKGHKAAPRCLNLLLSTLRLLDGPTSPDDCADASIVGTVWFLPRRRRVCRSMWPPAAVPWACVIWGLLVFVQGRSRGFFLKSQLHLIAVRQTLPPLAAVFGSRRGGINSVV